MAQLRRTAVLASIVALLPAPTRAHSKLSPGAPPKFDCEDNYANWSRDWSEEKKAWCCEDADSATSSLANVARAGCVIVHSKPPPAVDRSPDVPVGSSQMPQQHITPTKYDALKDSKMLQQHITPTKYDALKDSKPVDWPACGDECEFEGIHASCAQQVRRVAIKTFLGKPGACADAHRIVRQQCPICSGCSLDSTGCDVPALTPAPMREIPNAAPVSEPEGPPAFDPSLPPPQAQLSPACGGQCRFEGHTATCRDQVQWVLIQNFGGRPGSCQKARDLVIRECSVCSQCSLASAGCTEGLQRSAMPPPPPPPPPPSTSPQVQATWTTPQETTTWTWTKSQFDCNSVEVCDLWTDEHRHFCYMEGGVVCQLAPTTTKPFDCQDIFKVKSAWTSEKRQWCCKMEGLGCFAELAGVGVREGQAFSGSHQAMAFRKRYDADEPKEGGSKAEEKEKEARQDTHWVAVGATAGGCFMLGILLIVGRVRQHFSARAEFQSLPGPGQFIE